MTETIFATIRGNYQDVLKNIEKAAQFVDRDVDSIKLLVVTKGHPVETVRAVVAAGATCLGENYVEDAIPKIEALAERDGIRIVVRIFRQVNIIPAGGVFQQMNHPHRVCFLPGILESHIGRQLGNPAVQ